MTALGQSRTKLVCGRRPRLYPTSGPRLPGEKIITCDYRVRYPCYSPNAGQNDGSRLGFAPLYGASGAGRLVALRADSADQGKNIGQALVMSGTMRSNPGW